MCLRWKTRRTWAVCMWTRLRRACSFGTRRECCCWAAAATARGKQGGGWRELAEAFAKRHYPRAPDMDSLGRAGLHDAGRRALYRPVFGPHGKPAGRRRASQMGNDLRDGGGHAAHGYGAGQKAGRRSAFSSSSRSMLRPQLALNALEAAASLTPTGAALPAHGLRAEMGTRRSIRGTAPATAHASRRRAASSKIPRCGTLSWKGERRGFGSAASAPAPAEATTDAAVSPQAKCDRMGARAGESGSRVWEKRKGPRVRGG